MNGSLRVNTLGILFLALLAKKQYSIYEYKFVKCLKKTELPKKFFRNEEKLIRRITASNVISACLVFSRKIK